MRRGSLFLSILPPLLAVSVLTLAGTSAVGLWALRSLYYDTNRYALIETVKALANGLAPEILDDGYRAQDYCVRASRGTSFRITLISSDGIVLGDSRADPAEMDNHGGRPEVRAAMDGEPSFSLRRSATVGVDMLYVAVPVPGNGSIRGILRVSLAVPEMRERLAPFYASAGIGAFLLLGAVALVSVQLGRRISRPMACLGVAARSWAAGDFGRRVGRLEPAELDRLGTTLNSMAAELARRITLDAERTRELAAILDSIGEAVVAVDGAFRIRRANPSALVLSILEPGRRLEGLSLLEGFRSSEIQAAAEACMAAGERVDAEISIYRGSPRYFYLCAAPLAPPPGDSAPGDSASGAVLVLNDITSLRRLEQVRKDFVANVSHELRTPITLIKGFTETLQDPGVRASPEADRFLGILHRNAERMEALVDDLLTLARLENPDAPPLRREEVPIRPLLEETAAAVEPRRAARGSRVSVVCPEDLSAPVNEGLLAQAVLNLADNALKYSGDGAEVELSAEAVDGFLEIRVRDDGPGIPARHLPRIFERFYRVDKARSRQEGGTGLGLAIVRHIALAHGGEASVESREGAGSTFRIRVPMGWTVDGGQ